MRVERIDDDWAYAGRKIYIQYRGKTARADFAASDLNQIVFSRTAREVQRLADSRDHRRIVDLTDDEVAVVRAGGYVVAQDEPGSSEYWFVRCILRDTGLGALAGQDASSFVAYSCGADLNVRIRAALRRREMAREFLT